MAIAANDTHAVKTDGSTVWVNDIHGACVGRFSQDGVDMLSVINDALCPTSIQGTTVVADWDHFVSSLRDSHHIDIPNEYRPSYLNRI